MCITKECANHEVFRVQQCWLPSCCITLFIIRKTFPENFLTGSDVQKVGSPCCMSRLGMRSTNRRFDSFRDWFESRLSTNEHVMSRSQSTGIITLRGFAFLHWAKRTCSLDPKNIIPDWWSRAWRSLHTGSDDARRYLRYCFVRTTYTLTGI